MSMPNHSRVSPDKQDRAKGETRSVSLVPYLCAAGFLTALLWITWPYVEDDAYIHCQFARNLYTGGEFSFNPGQIVFGDSSPLWVFLLIGLRVLGLPFEMGAKLLSGAFALLSCWLLVRLIERCAGLCGRDSRLRAWSMALFLSHPFLIAIIPTGMETTLAVAWLLGFSLASERALLSDRILPGAGLGLAAALGTLVRPEFLLLGPCFVSAIVLRRLFHRSNGEGRWVGKAAFFLLLWAVVVAGIAAACYGYFGQVLPTTLRAKSYDAGLFSAMGAVRTAKVLAVGYGPLVLVALGSGVSWHRLAEVVGRIPLVLSGWALLLVGAYVAMSANVQTRYALLLWPWVAVFFALLAESAGTHARRRLVWASGLCFLLAASCITAFPAQVSRVYNSRQVRALCDQVVRDTPADAVLGVYAIGEIGYRTQRRLVDLGCIITPEMADVAPEKRLDFAMELGATYVMLPIIDLPRLGVSPGKAAIRASYRNATWQFPPSRYWEGWKEALVPVSEIRPSSISVRR